MFDDETLGRWTQEVQSAFPGCKVVEWDDRQGGTSVAIVGPDGRDVRTLWETPEDEEIYDTVEYRLILAVAKEASRQKRNEARRLSSKRKLVKA